MTFERKNEAGKIKVGNYVYILHRPEMFKLTGGDPETWEREITKRIVKVRYIDDTKVSVLLENGGRWLLHIDMCVKVNR